MSHKLERPRRPAIPMATYALFGVLLFERALLREGIGGLLGAVGRAACVIWLALLAVSFVCAIIRRTAALPLLALMLCVLPITLVATSWRLNHLRYCADLLSTTPVSQHAFVICSDPTQRETGFRYKADLCGSQINGVSVWLSMPEDLPRGTIVQGVGQFSPNADDEWGVSARMQGIAGTVRLLHVQHVERPQGLSGLAMDLRAHVCHFLQPDTSEERALLASCLCARKEGLSHFALDELFAECGVAHLVAVSGGHLSILMLLLSTLLRSIRLRPPLRVLMSMFFCGGFVICCGMPISAVRAWVMVACTQIGSLFGRRSHGLSAVSVVGLAMALFDPTLSGQVAFMLSVSSVVGLCLFSAYGSYVMHTLVGEWSLPRFIPHRMRRSFVRSRSRACDSLGASLATLLATIPIMTQVFGEVSLVGPLANTCIALPFSLFVGLGMVAVAFSSIPFVGPVLLLGCDLLAKVLLLILRLFASLPATTLTIEDGGAGLGWVAFACAIVLLIWWPHVSRAGVWSIASAVAIVMLCVFVQGRYLAPARLCVLDVGQGDAILIQDGSNAVLVDTGADGALLSALARNHVYHLDAVIITHLHADHYGALDDLAAVARCNKVFVAAGVSSRVPDEILDATKALGADSPQELAYGDVIGVGGFQLRMVWPCAEVDGSQNAHSIVLLASYERGADTLTTLLTGDAERDETEAVIEQGDVGNIDVLKVGHHGSEVSITSRQALVLDPEISVASAGEGNSYGHPRPECIEALEGAGSQFYCTKDVGDVDIRPGATGPIVRTQREP